MDESKIRIQNAKNFALEKHKEQKRKDMSSYNEHLEGVVNRLKNIGVVDADVICAAWLHDILEKTDVTFDDIVQRFGREVAVLVLAVSKNEELPKKEKENQYIQQLKEASIEAKIIKLCDISSNLKGLADAPLSKTQKNKKIRRILNYFRIIRKGISEVKPQYPKIQDIIDGINSVAIQFKQKPIQV